MDASRGGPSPPLVVDGLCGPLTRGAIARYQQGRIPVPDGRVDPEGPTLRALNADQGPGVSRAGGGGASPVTQAAPSLARQPPDPATVAAIVTLMPEVKTAISRADFQCVTAVPFCPDRPTTTIAESVPRMARESLQRLHDCFSLLSLPNPQLGLDNIRRVYRNMTTALNRSFGSDPSVSTILFAPNEFVRMETEAAAYTTRGGAFLTTDQNFDKLPTPANRIYICNTLARAGRPQRINTTIHELAHFVSGQPILIVDVVHRGHMLIAADRPLFDRLTPPDKLRSAEHYAFFASQAGGFLLP